MPNDISLWPLIGIAVIVAGFVLRFNPMLVVIAAAAVTAAAAGFPPRKILAMIGSDFIKTRNLPLILLLPLSVSGLLERHGLRQHAQNWIGRIRSATAGRLLILYLATRELTAALGITGLGGHPQMVRPLLAPMVEGAAQNSFGPLPERIRHRLRAHAAAADNIGLFYGEDIFVAFGAVLLMTTFLKESGIELEPLHVALWGIPTALSAFLIHSWRLIRLDRSLARELSPPAPTATISENNQNMQDTK